MKKTRLMVLVVSTFFYALAGCMETCRAIPDIFYLFDDLDNPGKALDSGSAQMDMTLIADSRIIAEDPRFGDGSLLIQKGSRAATGGWYCPLRKLPIMADGLSKMTIVVWLKVHEPQAVTILRRAQFEGAEAGVFAFRLDRHRRLTLTIDNETIQSAPLDVDVLGRWTNVAVTFNEGTVTFYVNGEQFFSSHSQASEIPPAALDGSLSFALHAPVGTEVDELGIFGSEELSEEQIKAITQLGLKQYLKAKN